MRMFLVSRDTPWEIEIVSFDKETQRAVLRGEYDEYNLPFPMTGPVAEKRKLNYRLEKRDA